MRENYHRHFTDVWTLAKTNNEDDLMKVKILYQYPLWKSWFEFCSRMKSSLQTKQIIIIVLVSGCLIQFLLCKSYIISYFVVFFVAFCTFLHCRVFSITKVHFLCFVHPSSMFGMRKIHILWFFDHQQ